MRNRMKEDPRGHRLKTRGRPLAKADWEDHFERLEDREDDRRFHPARDDEGEAIERHGPRDRKRRREAGREQ